MISVAIKWVFGESDTGARKFLHKIKLTCISHGRQAVQNK